MSRVDALIDALETGLVDYRPRTLVREADLAKHWHELQTPLLRAMWFGTDKVVKDSEIWFEDSGIIGEAQSGKSSVLKKAVHELGLGLCPLIVEPFRLGRRRASALLMGRMKP